MNLANGQLGFGRNEGKGQGTIDEFEWDGEVVSELVGFHISPIYLLALRKAFPPTDHLNTETRQGWVEKERGSDKTNNASRRFSLIVGKSDWLTRNWSGSLSPITLSRRPQRWREAK